MSKKRILWITIRWGVFVESVGGAFGSARKKELCFHLLKWDNYISSPLVGMAALTAFSDDPYN